MKPSRILIPALVLCIGLSVLRSAEKPMAALVTENFTFAAAQYGRMLTEINGQSGYPRTVEKGVRKLVSVKDWTSGFFPGSLWYLAEATGDPSLRAAAISQNAGIEPAKNNRSTHDVGFILYCSFGNGLRLGGDARYREIMLAGAESLITRFNAKVGCIQSWDKRRGWEFPVIIDNMMNLDLLMWASRVSGDPRFRNIAITHADTTMKHHFRADNSSFHVVDYDPATGAIRSRVTHQGAADSSAWARGQAWGLYGYTLMFRETKNPTYLAQAQKIAAFIMNHPRLPADKIPYWDFDAPEIPNAPRDSSAAAITCSALLELRTFVSADDAKRYTAFAEQQLRSLSSPAYRAKLGENGCFLLMHATGHKPGNSEIDVPINYGDYYFLEALHRYQVGLGKK